MRRLFVACALLMTLVSYTSAQDNSGPCGARLIRSKPSAWRAVTSETLKQCVPGQTDASVEDAGIRVGRFDAIQATIAIRNLNKTKTIKTIEWRLDVFDEQRKKLHDTLYPSEDKSIKPGESGRAARNLDPGDETKRILPRSAIILVQVSRITYQDGSTYVPAIECKTNESLDDATCGARAGTTK